MVECYVALGGNLEKTYAVMQEVVKRLRVCPDMEGVVVSPLYLCSPVSDIPQPPYLNAVCKFHTHLTLENLWFWIQCMEQTMGKGVKAKNAPRLIDLDLLFYGDLKEQTERWSLPHPSWKLRLFVLKPLADITHDLPIGEEPPLPEILNNFLNANREIVSKLQDTL